MDKVKVTGDLGRITCSGMVAKWAEERTEVRTHRQLNCGHVKLGSSCQELIRNKEKYIKENSDILLNKTKYM